MTEEQVVALLYELCVDLGFCPLGDATDPLYDAPPPTAEAFARAFFEADGQSFDDYPHAGIKAAVCAVITKHMRAALLPPGQGHNALKNAGTVRVAEP